MATLTEVTKPRTTPNAFGPDGGRYHVERRIGRGGMGEVYAVFDRATHRRVALKRLREQAGPIAAAMFEREYQTLAQLRHPNIVEVYEYVVDEHGAFYTMELLEGCDLANQAPMAWRDVCTCLRDAASVLGVLHARRLVHRDLSPGNLWRTPDGRIKLLDFGALAPFGITNEVVGTPPFVAPEALERAPLDARTDLYALGALGYWLLTSTHAFRALELGELPLLWERAPARPSSLAKLARGAADDFPDALDDLICALLRLNPNERPRTTVDVVDALNAIAQLALEAEDEVVQGYFDSKAFVSRAKERARFEQRLSGVRQGQPAAFVVEGPEGIGRTRLLDELATTARIAGMLVVALRASAEGRPYETACALARGLLRALPDEARRAAQPHRAVLGRLLPELGVVPGVGTRQDDAREERARRLAAFKSWLISLSRARPLALFVDDLHLADDESQALLAGLLFDAAGERVAICVSVPSTVIPANLSALQSLRGAALPLSLSPLTAAEALDLLRSMFGEAQHLERLATRLHRISGGVPRHLLLLAQHLLRTGEARYAEGAWTLPAELSEASLPTSLRAGVLASLDRLSPQARAFARLLSVPDYGPYTQTMCAALCEVEEERWSSALHKLMRVRGPRSSRARERMQSWLAELIACGVVQETERGVQIAHPVLREALRSELSPAERAHPHRVLGNVLREQAGADAFSQVRAGLHLMRAGDLDAGEQQMFLAASSIMGGAPEPMAVCAPMIAEGADLLRAAGRGAYALLPSLTVLAAAGYFVDRGYAARYGELAIRAFDEVLRLGTVRRLSTRLGKRAALILTLSAAGVALQVRPRAPSLRLAVGWYIGAIASLVATSTTCADPASVRRYAQCLASLTALGEDELVTSMYRYCLALALFLEGRFSESQRASQPLIAWLERGPIRDIPEATRCSLLAGAYLARGLRECYRTSDDALATAEQLERLGPLYPMQADQLRATYYAVRGDLELVAHYRRRVDVEAIEVGSAWQAELWTPINAAHTALWSHDAVAMKRAAQELGRLSAELPSFVAPHAAARASYLMLRGRHADAIALLDVPVEPFSSIEWARIRGLLASAHNFLGQHARAREICRTALAQVGDDDVEYLVASLDLQLELVLADAGLGDFEPAKAVVNGLLATHVPRQSPLLICRLHDTRTRLALLERDFVGARQHIEQTVRWARVTNIPSLIERALSLQRVLDHAERPVADLSTPHGAYDAHVVTRIELMLKRPGVARAERLQDALRMALELVKAECGFLMLATQDSLACFIGSEPSQPLIAWARERLDAADTDAETAVQNNTEELVDRSLRIEGELSFCATPLWATAGGDTLPVALLILGFARTRPQRPDADVLRVIARHVSSLSPH